MEKFKPLLAVSVNLKRLKFPVLVAPKLDGVRCLIRYGKAVTRKLKPVPNTFIRDTLSKLSNDGLDGELTIGSVYGDGVINRTTSGVMSKEGYPDFDYGVFDYTLASPEVPFHQRQTIIRELFMRYGEVHPRIWIIPHVMVQSVEELRKFEQAQIAAGAEGIVIRSIDGFYKHGRSTVKGEELLRLVTWERCEGKITGFNPLFHNDNPATKDELGHTKRSSAKGGKQQREVLGSFIVECDKFRETFEVGTGLTGAQRQIYWQDRKRLMGKLITFKYKPAGTLVRPRHPVFIAFRDKRDL